MQCHNLYYSLWIWGNYHGQWSILYDYLINFLWDSQKAKKKYVSTSVICSFIVVIMSNYIWFRGLYVNQMLIHSMFEWVTIMISNINKTTSNKLNGMSKKKLIFIVLILFLFVSSILLITNTQETSRVSLSLEIEWNYTLNKTF